MGEHDETWHGPTRWFGPAWMASKVLRLSQVKTFGEFLDKRELQHRRSDEVLARTARDELFVDFIADTGDGFNATYSVFRQLNPVHMGHPDLLVFGGDQVYPSPSAKAYEEKFTAPLRDAVPVAFLDHVGGLLDRDDLEAARALLRDPDCGDQRWLRHQRALLASELDAEGRRDLIAALGLDPPAVASPDAPDSGTGAPTEAPWLLAIPGNHDWYDGLSAFDRVFMTQRSIGAFETKQHRSYWAIALEVGGKRWWIWGIDIALDEHVDRAQLEYFMKCGARPGEPVVLVLAAPLWTYAPHRIDHLYQFERTAIFDQGLRPALVLSGDRHYYIRREAILEDAEGGRRPDAPPRITAGIGGAFKQAPHLELVTPGLWEDLGPDADRPNDNLRYRAARLKERDLGGLTGVVEPRSFPAEKESRRLVSFRRAVSSWWRWNRTFALIPFVLGLFTAATLLQTSQFWGGEPVTEATQWELVLYLVLSFNLLVLLVLFGAALAFSAPDPAAAFRKTQRTFWTFVHWAALVAALWASMWAAQEIAARWIDDDRIVLQGVVFLLLGSALTAVSVVLVILGYWVLTTRAQMSVNVLGSWSVEPNYVGFLRMRFTPDDVFVDVYGMTDIKTEAPQKCWRRRTGSPPLHPKVAPLWERAPLVHVDEFRVTR